MPGRLVEAQRLWRVDVEDDEHLGADAGAEADRLTGASAASSSSRGSRRSNPSRASARRPSATAPAAEVVAVAAGVLADEPAGAQRLDEAVGGADAQPGALGDVA